MEPIDFITTAKALAGEGDAGRPLESNLRRAASTTYYALFHCLAKCCADMLVGGSPAHRNQEAWRQAYRALNHETASKRCKNRERTQRFPPDIQKFAKLFVDFQTKRRIADYDPEPGSFNKSDVIQDILEAEDAIRHFADVPAKDRRAFAVYVLLTVRSQ